MTQHKTLTGKQEAAAVMVAADTLTNEQIAAEVGVTRRQVDRWKTQPAFIARVQEHIDATAVSLQRFSIADKMQRVAALEDDFMRMRQVVAERAAYEAAIAAQDHRKAMPGGTTGLMVRQWKAVGTGRGSHVVEEYVLDTGLLAAERATLKQAAQELGQWTEKAEVRVGLVDQLNALLDKPINLLPAGVTHDNDDAA